MVGAASGGPIGAIVGTLVGGWGVAKIQEVSGFHGSAFRVESASGSERIVRSPGQQWKTGDEVEVVQDRLIAHHDTPPLVSGK